MQCSISNNLLKNIIYTDGLLIDLRDTYQFNHTHIRNFINIPYHVFTNQKDTLPKSKPIYLICQSGKLAKKEAESLRNDGFKAFYIEGGMNALLEPPPTTYY